MKTGRGPPTDSSRRAPESRLSSTTMLSSAVLAPTRDLGLQSSSTSMFVDEHRYGRPGTGDNPRPQVRGRRRAAARGNRSALPERKGTAAWQRVYELGRRPITATSPAAAHFADSTRGRRVEDAARTLRSFDSIPATAVPVAAPVARGRRSVPDSSSFFRRCRAETTVAALLDWRSVRRRSGTGGPQPPEAPRPGGDRPIGTLEPEDAGREAEN